MEIKYPIFVKDKDGWVSIVHRDVNELEIIDVENEEFNVWDSAGLLLHLYVQKEGKSQKIKVKPLNTTPQPNVLKEAMLTYARLARPKVPFVYAGPEDDIVELFKAAEEHINAGRLREKIKRRIRRIWKNRKK